MTAPIVVTPEAVSAAFNESVLESAPERLADVGDPVVRAAFMAALPGALRAVSSEASTVGPGLMFAPQNSLASRLMSAVADAAPEGSALEPLTAGGLELKFATNDWWGWFKSIFDRVSRSKFHPLVRPAGHEVTTIPNTSRIVMLGDWGTGLYGAPVAAATIAGQAPVDLLMHLGDVYYSGTDTETDQRFLSGWPHASARLHRAVNSNHEMYSGGHAFFKKTLPRFGQDSSYFALSNDHWLLLGLDTGYVDHDVDAQQATWVEEMIARADGRRVILFSHHQLVSRFSPQGTKLQRRLQSVLESGGVTAWYWGHEHRCVMYAPDPRFGEMWGRCVGHGGMPERRGKFAKLPIERREAGVMWRRFTGRDGAPGGLILDGENPHIPGEEKDYGPHGYGVLELDDGHANESFHLPDGTPVHSAPVQP